jgi:hypothetical protein
MNTLAWAGLPAKPTIAAHNATATVARRTIDETVGDETVGDGTVDVMADTPPAGCNRIMSDDSQSG